jgi:14-3-3 protein epsilon
VYLKIADMQVEKELVSVCNELLGLLDSHLIPAASANNEAKVFYLKMKVTIN